MSFREREREASFRGVPFLVDSRGGRFGRAKVVHEFPGRDEHLVEDQGERPDRFTVSGLLIGEDHDLAELELIRACKQSGPGLLVHPYYGELQVEVEGEIEVSARSSERRMTSFRVTFVAASTGELPTSVIDTRAAVEAQAVVARAAALADFEQVFVTEALPEWIADDSEERVLELADALEVAAGRSLGGGPAVANLARDIASLRSGVLGLVRTPSQLGSRIVGLLEALGDLETDPRRTRDALRELVGFGQSLLPVPETTATRRRQADNRAALTGLVRFAAVVEMARTFARIDFDSYDEAAAARSESQDLIDAEILVAGAIGADDTYHALQDLYAETVRDVTARGATLSRITVYEPSATLPALVIAHDLYGDALRAEELVRRNRIRHPGFVAGGRALEVLSDVG